MKLRVAAAALLLTSASAFAQNDFLGDRTAEEVIAEYAEQAAPFVEPELNIGDDAPDLSVTEFVKGAPVDGFEDGKVYLIDFWATWCGPCIRAMPHVSDLQDEYSGDGLQVIGVDIWESKRTPDGPEPIVGDERSELVKGFVEKHDENMRYTVAIDGEQKLEREWMKPSGQNGIPTAMIVDRDGKLAWIGYGNDPKMNFYLETILDGEHDLVAMREARNEELRKEQSGDEIGTLFKTAGELLSDGEEDEALALMTAMSKTYFEKDAMGLNALAWNLVDREDVSKKSAKLAKMMATQASELGDWKDANVLDTLGWANHYLGDHAEAIRIETLAIKHATADDQRADFVKVLKKFKKAAE